MAFVLPAPGGVWRAICKDREGRLHTLHLRNPSFDGTLLTCTNLHSPLLVPEDLRDQIILMLL